MNDPTACQAQACDFLKGGPDLRFWSDRLGVDSVSLARHVARLLDRMALINHTN
jgi:hypothetical protein